MGPSGSQTQRTEPPKYQLPYLQYGVQQARSLYDSGQPTVAPQSQASQQALNGMQNLATAGNGITGAAGNLATQTLNGGFLNSNPYIDQTFNRAAMATEGQLASQFGTAGRDVNESSGNRAQQLNDLASRIYGGNYANERALQQQTLGMSPGLAQGQYTDLDRLLGVGQQQEGYQQRQLDAPGNALDQYMGRVSGNMGTTIKTSGGGNQLGSLLGGGLLGGLFGGLF